MNRVRALVLAFCAASIAACGGPSGPDTSSTARFQGHVMAYVDGQGTVPAGLKVTLGDGSEHPITSSDGSFSIANSGAQFANAKLVFTGPGLMPAIVRTSTANATTNLVLLPASITIPTCSVYRGQAVPLDLIAGFKPASEGQTGFLDRVSTMANSRLVVVANWNLASIPVAMSDTGGVAKQFSAQDSTELISTLAQFSSYMCQAFHMASVADARREGIVVVKDPAFAALGAHSMAVPSTRGDYVRGEVVLRRLFVNDVVARDSVRRTVMHEFLHVLGFGHSCSWPTVMTTGTICPAGTYTFTPSPQDVAHYFAMRYARQGERALSSLESLGPAYLNALVASGKMEAPIASFYAPK